jgi:hypothetical protein
MGPSNTLQLIIEVDALQANSTLRVTREGLVGLERQSMTSGRNAAAGMDQFAGGIGRMRTEVYEGTQAARLLGSEIGVTLPRSVSKFLAQSALIGPALSSAFEVGVFIAIGVALVQVGRKLYDWVEGTKEAEEATKRLKEEQKDLNKYLDDYGSYLDKMAKLRHEGAVIGLTGSAKTASDIGEQQRTVNSLKVAYEDLLGPLNQINFLMMGIDPKTGDNIGRASARAIQAAKDWGEADKKVDDAHRAYLLEQADLEKRILDLKHQQGDEADKVIEERLKNQLEAAKLLTREYEKMAGTAKTEGLATYGGLEIPKSIDPLAGLLDKDKLKDLAEAGKLTEELGKSNATLRESILKGRKDYRGAAQIEIDALNAEEEKFSGNEAAIAAIEERKKLLIEQANAEIARDAQTQFDKTANAIEGFFNRVFLTAKSFADVWKQLWTQAVGFVLNQFARMAAAMVMGRGGGGMAPAGAAASSSGILGALSGIMPGFGGGNQGGLMSPGFNPGFWNSGGTGGGSTQGGGGILGMLRGGGAGILGNLKSFVGLGPGGGGGAHLQDILKSGGQATLGTTLSNIGHSNAALMGGALLAINGLQRGGIAGLGETTLGGAMIGFKFRGPVGAAIGAGIGAVAGTIRLFIKGSIEKAHDKIKAAYGVDIADKGVLSQIVDIAKQGYGGNLDMAIRTSQVADLVRLYAMSTNQGTGRMAAPMTSSTMIESGGRMSLAPTYYGGNILGGGLPGSGLAGAGGGYGGSTVIKLDGPATTALLQGQVVKTVQQNPRIVQAATMKATQQSFNRRQMTALMLSPGTLTS